MIISVASGKGGTGKTTVATSLARSATGTVQLLDCDVEEPNAHLFLKPEILARHSVSTMVPEIDQARCSGCRRCADICRFGAITVVGGTVLTFPALCHGCGGCVAVCPEGAIGEGGRELGVIEIGKSDGLMFGAGRLRVGEAMAPPLIRKVREQTIPSALTIIDAPPGTSCPVIAAMRATDFVLLVTEPTPFGLHDLQLAVAAVRLLAIPCGLVINRADLGDAAVYDYARREALPVLLEIPFDRDIATAYAEGRLLAEALPAWREKFQGLLAEIPKLAACSLEPGRTS